MKKSSEFSRNTQERLNNTPFDELDAAEKRLTAGLTPSQFQALSENMETAFIMAHRGKRQTIRVSRVYLLELFQERKDGRVSVVLHGKRGGSMTALSTRFCATAEAAISDSLDMIRMSKRARRSAGRKGVRPCSMK